MGVTHLEGKAFFYTKTEEEQKSLTKYFYKSTTNTNVNYMTNNNII